MSSFGTISNISGALFNACIEARACALRFLPRFLSLSGIFIIQSTSYVLYKLANWVIRNNLNFGPKFRPSGDWKMAPIVMWSDHYLEYWSLDPLHTWCMHWLCKFSEMSRYLATLTIFALWWPKKWQQSEAFESYLEYWSLNTLHTG